MSGGVQVRPSGRFLKALARLAPKERERATRALQRFVVNPNYPGLNFEPIRNEPGSYTIRSGLQFRILLRKEDDGVYTVVDVDTHEIYRRRR